MMEAGAKLNALVAEKVMGLEMAPDTSRYVWNDISGWMQPPAFSTDIAAAWLVVERMNSIKMDTPEGYQLRAKWSFGIHGACMYNLSAEQAAYEICLCACRAMGALPQEG